MIGFFLSADWSKQSVKRSVYVADVRNRRIRRCAPPPEGWTVDTLLDKGRRLAVDGPVLAGADVVLGVPRGYWEQARRVGGGYPGTFVDWLASLPTGGDFYETVKSPEEWRVGRPWFHVPSGAGGLNGFKRKVDGGMLRAVELETGGKPVFAVSGIPGTVGGGTREFWRELAPRLSVARDFEVWPFEGDRHFHAPTRGITLCETYPRLAYGTVLAGELPTATLAWPKTRPQWRTIACDCITRTEWVAGNEVVLEDVGRARDNEDDFDALFTAAAVLRCLLENRPLCRADRVDEVAEGSMLLAGIVESG